MLSYLHFWFCWTTILQRGKISLMHNIVFVHAFPSASVTFRPQKTSVTCRNVFIVCCHTRWRSLLVFESSSRMVSWVLSFRTTFVVGRWRSPAWTFGKFVCTTSRRRKFFWKCWSRRILKSTHSLRRWERGSLLLQAHEETKLGQTDAAGPSADPFSRQKPLTSRIFVTLLSHRSVRKRLWRRQRSTTFGFTSFYSFGFTTKLDERK